MEFSDFEFINNFDYFVSLCEATERGGELDGVQAKLILLLDCISTIKCNVRILGIFVKILRFYLRLCSLVIFKERPQKSEILNAPFFETGIFTKKSNKLKNRENVTVYEQN